MNEEIRKHLTLCGLSPDLSGYDYSVAAIEIISSGNVKKVSDVYYKVARRFKSSSCCIERAIRTAIEKVFNAPTEHTREVFPAYSDAGKPTNKQFLYTLARLTEHNEDRPEEAAAQEETQTKQLFINNTCFVSDNVLRFIEEDNNKADKLIEQFPINVPVAAAADFLGMDPASLRAAIENGVIGAAWRKPGKSNHGYYLPTAQLIRWYLQMR